MTCERLKMLLYRVDRFEAYSHTQPKVSKGKKMALLDLSPVIHYYHIAVSCICDSLWCDSLGKWTDIQPLKWVESTRGGQCSSCRFRAMLQYNPPHEMNISNLALNHSSLSPFRSLFLSLALSHTHTHTYWHVVIHSQSEWWPLHMKYRLFIIISAGQAGTVLKSWTLRVSITRRDKTKAP